MNIKRFLYTIIAVTMLSSNYKTYTLTPEEEKANTDAYNKITCNGAWWGVDNGKNIPVSCNLIKDLLRPQGRVYVTARGGGGEKCIVIHLPPEVLNNATFGGDPVYGKLKTLAMSLTIDGTLYNGLRAYEGREFFHYHCYIPSKMKALASWYGLEGDKHQFLSQGQMDKVLDLSYATYDNGNCSEVMIPGNRINQGFIGINDPAPGKAKLLAISFDLLGKEVGVRAHENTDFYWNSCLTSTSLKAYWGYIETVYAGPLNNVQDFINMRNVTEPKAFDDFLKNAVDVTNKIIELMSFDITHKEIMPSLGENLTYTEITVTWNLKISANDMKDTFLAGKSISSNLANKRKILFITIPEPRTLILGAENQAINWSYAQPIYQ